MSLLTCQSFLLYSYKNSLIFLFFKQYVLISSPLSSKHIFKVKFTVFRSLYVWSTWGATQCLISLKQLLKIIRYDLHILFVIIRELRPLHTLLIKVWWVQVSFWSGSTDRDKFLDVVALPRMRHLPEFWICNYYHSCDCFSFEAFSLLWVDLTLLSCCRPVQQESSWSRPDYLTCLICLF